MVEKKNKASKKKIRSKIIMQNGGDVISATGDMINAMIGLGQSIFTEINSITHIQSDINNAASPSPGTPNQINGPPPFNQPF
jgi:hypothetical protein